MDIKYPKLFLLVLTFVVAYFIFSGRDLWIFKNFLFRLGYLGIFVSGMMFSYGFTAAPATALLLIIPNEYNIFLASAIGGVGALFSDLLLFKFIKTSLNKELRYLSKEKFVRYTNKVVPEVVRKYFIPVFAGFIIASPLPDEIGVFLLADSRNISTKVFSVLSFLLNTIGIFVVLSIGNSL